MFRFSDSKEKYFLKEIVRCIDTKTSEVLGSSENAKKTVSLDELKKFIDGARSDEPRLRRAVQRLEGAGAVEAAGFGWVTTPKAKEVFEDIKHSD